jgi:response regulator RpfG family c-di-GMP phosphodiesterase
MNRIEHRDQLRVLFLEDAGADVAPVTETLRRLQYDVQIVHVASISALARALDNGRWDVVLATCCEPGVDGQAALRAVRERSMDLPFILVADPAAEAKAFHLMNEGANDCILGGHLARLGPVIQRELREVERWKERDYAYRSLQESDERQKAILATATDGIITYDQEAVIESLNPAAESMFGYSAEELVGTSLHHLLSPPGVPPLAAAMARGTRGPAGAKATKAKAVQDVLSITSAEPAKEASGTRKDGSSFSAELAVGKCQLRDRALYTCIVHDTTQRIRAQEHIRIQFERISALRAIDVAITGSFDLRVTLNIVLDQVTTLLNVDAADILIHQSSGEMHCASARGFRLPAFRQARLRIGEGLPGAAALSRTITEVTDLSNGIGDQRAELIRREKFHFYLCVPLIAKGNIIGVLEVFHRSAFDRDADWTEFLEALAGQAAIAIDSISMYDELQRTNTELLVSYDATIEGWSRALDLRDHETEGHTRRVADLTVRLAAKMGFSESAIADARRGALLHDVGKIGVPDSVLLKPGPLTESERNLMEKHPVFAYEWLSPIRFLRNALDIPYCHHERWDGTGYPRRLAGEDIPAAARLFAIIDVWDALRSQRPYREPWSEEKALAHIREGSGSHFDPEVVTAFTELILEMRQKEGAA